LLSSYKAKQAEDVEYAVELGIVNRQARCLRDLCKITVDHLLKNVVYDIGFLNQGTRSHGFGEEALEGLSDSEISEGDLVLLHLSGGNYNCNFDSTPNIQT
jgi:hypothetical protein